MTGFRIGDRRVVIAGQTIRLRLTLSALAEIARVTECDSPAALAAHLREKKDGVALWGAILVALATPRPTQPLSEHQFVDLLPDIVAVITEGLAP